MKRYPLFMAALAILFVAACEPQPHDDIAFQDQESPGEAREDRDVALVDHGPDEHLVYRPDDVEWWDPPPTLEPGARVAVLEGDPSEFGLFTMRIRMPDGYHIAPHSHPNVERVTVVSGTFRLGNGEELDPDAAEPLEAGSYTSIPPGEVHYAVAEGETVIQLSTIGPWVIEYVNPEDMPAPRE
jgi:quercetin dioxygenase-like cupin family protein